MFSASIDLVIPNVSAAILSRAEAAVTKLTKKPEVSKPQLVVQWLRETIITVVSSLSSNEDQTRLLDSVFASIKSKSLSSILKSSKK